MYSTPSRPDLRKLLSLASVTLLLMAGVVVCIQDSDVDGATTIESDSTVTLDVSGSFKDNATELAKLGLHHPSSWVKAADGYVLTIENINFVTTAPCAIEVINSAGVKSTLHVRCIGNNTFTAKGVVEMGTTYCIFADPLADVGLHFFGDGAVSFVTDVGMDPSTRWAIAIFVNDLVVEGCTLIAYGSDLCCDIIPNNMTVGIWSDTFTVLGGATVIGHGGEIKIYGKSALGLTSGSIGIWAGSQDVQFPIRAENSMIVGIGGKVETGPEADSTGSMSHGITDAGGIELKSSIIYGQGGCVSTCQGGTSSIGIVMAGLLRSTDSSICAVAGKLLNTDKSDESYDMSVGMSMQMRESGLTHEFIGSSVFVAGSSIVTENSDRLTAGIMMAPNNPSYTFKFALTDSVFHAFAGLNIDEYTVSPSMEQLGPWER